MGRIGTYQTTVEDCLKFSLKSLFEDNFYFNSYGTRSGTTSWSRNGEVHSKIDFQVFYSEYQTHIIFAYTANGTPIKYKVDLINLPSNLGKGKVWYFVCPSTGKHCRKLYLRNGYFLHRTAHENLMYECQLESKRNRDLRKIFQACFIPDTLLEAYHSKYLKTHYKGKITKKYAKLKNKIETARNYPPDTISKLMMQR